MAGSVYGKMIGDRIASGKGKRAAAAMPFSAAGMLCACLMVLLSIATLSGCTAPVRAPVVARDHPPVPQSRSRPTIHRVRSGDTLYSIAWRFGIDYTTIARWNGIRYPYTIYPGQRLRLAPPVRGRTASPARSITPQTRGAPGKDNPVVSNKGISRSPGKGVISNPAEEKPGSASLKLQWLWPTNGTVVQGFVSGDPVRKGVKIEGRYGASVKAAETGKVVYAGSGLIGYGRLVIIKHNKNYLSAYGHNKTIHVKEGDTVEKGIRIAEMGSDGNGKPTLHFEIRRNGAPVDPLKLLPRRP